MTFNIGKIEKKNTAPKSKPLKKATSSRSSPSRPVARTQKTSSQPVLKGGAGYRKYEGDALWLPNTTRPAWLDGSLPGDRGFDPLGLSKPVEYLQFDLDQLDQNQAQ